MKILIISAEFPPQLGGAGVFAYQYAVELSRKGHSVTVITSRIEENKIENEDFEVIPISRKGVTWPYSFYAKANEVEYDLIILNDPPAIYMAGIFFNSKHFYKSCCFLHGSEADTVYRHPALKRRFLGFRWFYNKAMEKAKFVFFPSESMRNSFFKKLPKLNFKEKSLVSYGGVNTSLFDISNLKFNNDSGGKVRIVSASRIKEKKGYLTKLDLICGLIQEYGVDLSWDVVGDGDFLLNLKRLAKLRGIEDYVTFHGKISRQELAVIFGQSDIFLLLSDYEESFGLVYLEAAACGCPSVGYNRDGIKEAISHEKSGLLIDNSEEFLDIILDKRWASLDRSSCRDFAEKNNVKIHVARFLSYVE